MDSGVDKFFKRAQKWQKEMEQLRKILLDCQLGEELKWGKPCYTFQGKNIVIIQGFKEYCALLFFKGALLNNDKGILVKTGENTQVGRQIRFTDGRKIVAIKADIKAIVYEAIEVEKAGLKVVVDHSPKLIPEELQIKLDTMPALKMAFHNLTPGRQRAYIYHFSSPKQSKTRTSRVEKCIPQILDGRGLNE